MPQLFFAPDYYGDMLWHGHPDDPMPAPRLSRSDLMDGPADHVGAEVWDGVQVGVYLMVEHPDVFSRYLDLARRWVQDTSPDRAGGVTSGETAA